MMKFGTVKWFSPDIGFGYITPEIGEGDVLVMGNALINAGLSSLNIGKRFSYELNFDEFDGQHFATSLRAA